MNDASKNKGAKYHHQKEVDIDMNPMVDLAFLLLTFFMLTTTFNTPQVMEIVMPVKPNQDALDQEQPIKESKALSLVLGPNNALYWYRGITDAELQQIDYSDEGIRELLVTKNQQIQDLVILIKPHPRSVFKNLVDILDELNYTKSTRYAIDEFRSFDQNLLDNFNPPIE